MPSQPSDGTNIAKHYEKLVAAVNALSPEKRAAAEATIIATLEGLTATTQQSISRAAVVDTKGALATSQKKNLPPDIQQALMSILKSRFERNGKLHPKTNWSDVERALNASPETLRSLQRLEETGGEPDVFLDESDAFIFGDTSAESPFRRSNVVFDKEAEYLLRANAPRTIFNGNAADKVKEWNVDFMDETQYQELQKLKNLDRNTCSWLKTPANIRGTGNALVGNYNSLGLGVGQNPASSQDDRLGFRCAVRVKKA